jgi:hypothetical protein
MSSFVPSGCKSSNTHPCAVMLTLTATRYDGTFMFDKTVQMQLLDPSTSPATVLGTHSYGTGGIGSDVQINSITPPPYWDYQTNFDGSTLTFGSYGAQVLFMDVDGNLITQPNGSTSFSF